MPRRSSGSSLSASGVDPDRSANRIVTTLRCSASARAVAVGTWSDVLSVDPAAGAAPGAVTGAPTVAVVAVFGAACAAAIGVPQPGQKRSLARTAAPQLAHFAFAAMG